MYGGDIVIRAARPGDGPLILGLIRELAAYERSPDQVLTTEDSLDQALFGPEPAASALVAEDGGEAVGFALWFQNFSTWTGPGMHLEDLYVRPAARRSGLGRALLAELAAICVDRGYARLDWAVLDWNASALEFYTALGAVAMDDWRIRRLTGPALTALAGRVGSGAPGA
jgi:GNAT superfamily N-acetyltransferase